MDSELQQMTLASTPLQTKDAEKRQREALAIAIDRMKLRGTKRMVDEEPGPGRFDKPLPPVHDNGAVVPPTIKQRRTQLMEQLMAELKKNNDLREHSAQLTNDPVFDTETQPPITSSEIREGFGSTRNETLLMTTMSNWTLSNVNIPECNPMDGGTEINKRSFDYWKDIFYSSIQIVNTTDEQTMFGLFMIKAGPKLRDIYNTPVSGPGMPINNSSIFECYRTAERLFWLQNNRPDSERKIDEFVSNC